MCDNFQYKESEKTRYKKHKYYNSHKEQIIMHQLEMVICDECCMSVMRCHLSRHKKGNAHFYYKNLFEELFFKN